MPSMPVSCQSRSRSGGAAKRRVHAHRIRAVTLDHLVGRDGVAQALRHLGTVFDHHALREEALRWFVVFHQSHVAHELGPEARIDEVKNGVLHSADVLVDWETSSRFSPDQTGLYRCARRCSGRSTMTNRRTYPSCRSRAAPGPHTSGKSCSGIPAHFRAAIHRPA